MNRIATLVVPLLISSIAVVGFVVLTGHLNDGPQMVDDNQIYKLQIEFEEDGFLAVFGNELRGRFMMRRLVPVYSIQKILLARVFGENLVAWSIWTGLIGAFAAGFLFHFFRLCDGTVLASAAFALIAVIGEQSVVWYRMLHGEGIGMLVLSIGLVAMMWFLQTKKLRYEVLFLLCVSLATLSKESFIVAIPAILFLQSWLTVREQQTDWRSAVRQNWRSIVWLTFVMIVELAIVKFVFATTSFSYAGWKGFDAVKLQTMVQQYLEITNASLLAALLVLAFVLWMMRSDQGGNRSQRHQREKTKKAAVQPTASQPGRSLAMAAAFCLILVVPQLFLYMSTGMLNINAGHFGRYIFPGIIGYAFLVAELIRLIQMTTEGNRSIVALIAFLLTFSIGDKTVTAFQEAREFADVSRTLDSWFTAIENNTKPEDPIVVAFLNGVPDGYSLQVALRVYYILSRRHNRDNVYYCPIPPKPTLEQSRSELFQADSRRHAKKMRSVEQMDPSQPPAAIMVINQGSRQDPKEPISFTMSRWLAVNPHPWFDRQKYRLKIHRLGHVTYFRNDQ